MSETPRLDGLNFIVREMHATRAFWRLFGFEVDDDNDDHVRVHSPGMPFELDSVTSVPAWNRGYNGVPVNIGFQMSTREGVDELYSRLTRAGYPGQQEPFDAPWGRRFAVVSDPDGNGIGLMSAS